MRGMLLTPRIVVCKQCSNPFESNRGNKKFCSNLCKNRWHDSHRPVPRAIRRKCHRLICEECGNEFMGELHHRFCSTSCASKKSYKTNGALRLPKGKDNPNWKGGYIHGRVRKYGITGIEYEKLMNNQNNKCAICGKEPNGYYKRLGVDHDHVTGKVRGLLCPNCNTAVGLLKDDIVILSRAIDYLSQYETKVRRAYP